MKDVITLEVLNSLSRSSQVLLDENIKKIKLSTLGKQLDERWRQIEAKKHFNNHTRVKCSDKIADLVEERDISGIERLLEVKPPLRIINNNCSIHGGSFFKDNNKYKKNVNHNNSISNQKDSSSKTKSKEKLKKEEENFNDYLEKKDYSLRIYGLKHVSDHIPIKISRKPISIGTNKVEDKKSMSIYNVFKSQNFSYKRANEDNDWDKTPENANSTKTNTGNDFFVFKKQGLSRSVNLLNSLRSSYSDRKI